MDILLGPVAYRCLVLPNLAIIYLVTPFPQVSNEISSQSLPILPAHNKFLIGKELY